MNGIQEMIQQVLDMVRRTWRYRWLAILLAWPLALGGWAWVHQQPDEYRASTRVYVDTQSLLEPLMRGLTVMPRVDQQLEMVTQTLLSRPNLEEVARRSDLDLGARNPEEFETVVNRLRSRISLKGSPRDNLYTITYMHHDPSQAREVVQLLLNIFVESSLGNTRNDLGSSQAFITEQIKSYEERIAELEQRLKEFKRKNHDMLPGQGSDYYSKLREAGTRLEQARLQLEEAERRRDAFQARLDGEDMPLLLPGSGESGSESTELDGRIARLESQLDELRLRYTDEHPDVMGTKRVLDDLKRQRDEILAARAPATPSHSGGQPGAYIQQLQFALAEAESQVASLRARVEDYQVEYERLQAAVDRIPEVEQQYKEMTRDYEVLQSRHRALIDRRETAMLSGQVQTGTESITFRVVDPPHVPSEPAGPNRLLMAMAVFVVSVGGGTGTAFGLGQIRRTVTSRHALHSVTRRPFLGAVSINETPWRRRRRRLDLAAYAASVVALIVAFGGVIMFFTVG